MRRVAAMAAVLAALAVLPLAPSSMALDYNQHGVFTAAGTGGASLAGYDLGVGASARRVFDSVTVDAFDGAGLQAEGVRERARGANASFTIHDTPHAAVVVEAFRTNAAHFALPPSVGAIPRGAWASVGDEGFTGALILLGQGLWAKDGSVLTADLRSGERAMFRASIGGEELAPWIAEGTLVADVTVGPRADVLSYVLAQVTADRDGSVATVRVSGAGPGRMVAITADRGTLDPATLAVDGAGRLRAYSSMDALLAAGSGYVVHSDARAVEVVVLADLTDATLRVGILGPSADAVLGVVLVVVTFAAATWALARRRQGVNDA